MERRALKTLLRLVVDEIVFLDRGWGKEKPETLVQEYKELQEAREWIELKVDQLNRREYPND